MALLIAAVVLVGAVCALDLVLTVGVVKRLREHTALLASFTAPPVVEVGKEIDAFEATTVDGELVTREAVASDALVGFFSPTCGPCQEKLPKFVAYSRGLPGGDRPLAVVVGDAAQASDFVTALSPVARVVVEDRDGALSQAFGARAFPTLLRVGRDAADRLVVTDNQVEVDRPAMAAA